MPPPAPVVPTMKITSTPFSPQLAAHLRLARQTSGISGLDTVDRFGDVEYARFFKDARERPRFID